MAGPYTATGVTRMAEKSSVTAFHTTSPHRQMFSVFHFFRYYTIEKSAPKSLDEIRCPFLTFSCHCRRMTA